MAQDTGLGCDRSWLVFSCRRYVLLLLGQNSVAGQPLCRLAKRGTDKCIRCRECQTYLNRSQGLLEHWAAAGLVANGISLKRRQRDQGGFSCRPTSSHQ